MNLASHTRDFSRVRLHEQALHAFSSRWIFYLLFAAIFFSECIFTKFSWFWWEFFQNVQTGILNKKSDQGGIKIPTKFLESSNHLQDFRQYIICQINHTSSIKAQKIAYNFLNLNRYRVIIFQSMDMAQLM